MNDSIKTFSLVVITICVFIMTVIQILNMMEQRKEREVVSTGRVSSENAAVAQSDPPTETKTPAIDISNMPKTTIEFSETKFDFGDLQEGDVVKHSFNFKNTGSSPLIIAEAHGSCGCTIPLYPKEPIPPGGTGEIEVQFNSFAKPGLQNKTVTVTANTEPSQTVLNISSNVKKNG
jgi:hypothetical protein